MSRLSPMNQARWARFRRNRRGYWSLWIFLMLFGLSLCAELIANDKPLLVRYDGSWYFPLVKNYSESQFGGPLASAADYQDPWLKQRLEEKVGCCGRRYALVRTVLTTRQINLSLHHLPHKTGWEQTLTAAMYWHVFYMAHVFQFFLV